MILPRTISLPAVVLFGTLWAGLVVEVGLWLLIDGPRSVAVPHTPRILGGLSAMAAGLVVFMVVVADRLFPSVGRRLSMWRLEMAMMFLFLLSGAACLLAFSWGI